MEIYKTLMKELKEHLNEDIGSLWSGRIRLLKMSVLVKLMKRYSAIPIPIPANSLAGIVKLTLKSMWKVKRPRLPSTEENRTKRTHNTQF